ncbi:unnamed protein product [Toxocara canis]|uniref:CBAH domain-containing protein n=1 Tax=Toxocara canis TaxID=6265 RepID=A0A183TZK6_TOXCA|nr:unnamed protein product [Toxocara canis]
MFLLAVYFPLMGQCDECENTIFARFVPANPLEGNARGVPLISFTMHELLRNAYWQRAQRDEKEPIDELPWRDMFVDNTHYPLLYKSSLYFFFSQQKLNGISFMPNALLEVDIAGVLSGENCSPNGTLRYVHNDLAMRDAEVLECYSASHYGAVLVAYWARQPIASFTFHFAQFLRVLDLDSLTWRNLSELHDEYAPTLPLSNTEIEWINVLPGNRILCQGHGCRSVAVYTITRIAISVPSLQQLAFWATVEAVKAANKYLNNVDVNAHKSISKAYYYLRSLLNDH